jgi:uncharacterized protein
MTAGSGDSLRRSGMSTPAPVAPPAAAPLDATERLHAIDILRGLALFGMILVHFHQKTRLEVTGVEDLIPWAVWVGVEQKAWATFAFLFGVGFAILLRRLEARGASVVPIYLRRLATLACFGIIAEVGFGFSILWAYAMWGLALLVLRTWSTRALLVTAAIAASIKPIVAEVGALYAAWSATPRVVSTSAVWYQAVEAATRQKSYLTLLAARWDLFVATHPATWQDFLPDVNLALFILGLLAVRHGILDQPMQHVRTIVRWMIFGVLSWGTAWLVLRNIPTPPIPGADWPIAYGFGLVQDQWLCFTYIGAVVLLLAYRPVWTARLAAFGRSGRMALTNYMFQAVVLDIVSSGYGLDWKLRPYVYVVAAVLLFTVEALFSTAWLERFRFGPLEWVWRMLTYARYQPLRRAT